MADPFKMVIAIVAIYAAVSFAKMMYRDKELSRSDTGQADDHVVQKIAALEERIRVLETIVTDDRHALKREIDQL
ncbi:MAG: hypothetical protein AB8G16_12970 [Gammaproteobacteria bacterium]